jgi:uncharacterized RDD family membrane protein YckC
MTTWLPPEGADPSFAPVPAQHWASFGQRVGAYLLDLAIQVGFVVVVTFALLGPAYFTEDDPDVDPALDVLTWVFTAGASLLYYALLMRRSGTHNGQTWGRQAAGIQVVRDDGKPVSGVFAAYRDYLVKGLLSTFTLGIDLLWPLWERENRTLHDLLLHTHVVSVEHA